MSIPLHVLLIEDNEDDALLILRELKRGGFDVSHRRVFTVDTMRAALEVEKWDLILSDHSLGGFTGIDALQIYRESGLDIPFIIVSGTISEVIAVSIMKAGAHDYVPKDKLTRLNAAVERELRETEQRRRRRWAEAAQREAESRYRAIFENAVDGIFQTTPEGQFIIVNPALARILGYDSPEDLLASVNDIGSQIFADPGRREEFRRAADRHGKLSGAEYQARRKDGSLIWLSENVIAVRDEKGQVIHYEGTIEDITARKEAEEKIQQQLHTISALYTTAQKLTEGLDLDLLADDIVHTCVRAFGATLAWLGRADPDGRVQCLCAYGQAAEAARRLSVRWDDAPEGQGSVGSAIRQRAPVVIHNMAEDPRLAPWRPFIRENGFQCLASYPLISRDSPFGVLAIVTDSHGFFDSGRVEFFQNYAHQCAAALENARLYAETKRRLEHVQALRAIDVAITGSLDLRFTLDVFLEQVISQLAVDAADIFLLDMNTHTLHCAAARGFRTNLVAGASVRLGSDYAGRVALERQAMSVPDVSGADVSPLFREVLAREGFVSYRAVPLVSKGQVKGVLEIFHRSPLEPDREWLDYLDTLAGQAAIAVDNASLFDDLQRSNVELRLAYDATIEGWSRALDLRDKETEGHTQRVTELTEQLARAVGMNGEELLHVRRGALLHDIGKMGVPDAILLKPGPLTDEEWVLMRKHPEYAVDMLAPIAYLRRALDIPYCHHEKWDGTGYPRGLKDEQIPLSARIFAVVDVWDALRSDRPYRAAWPVEKALAHIQSLSGSHFDPQAVELFLSIIGGQ